jgi:hypothetical protein
MAAIPINLTVAANKNVNDEAINGFIRIYPNLTADPTSPDFVPGVGQAPDGISDEEWMEERTRQWLNDIINVGQGQEFDDTRPPADPDIVE